MVLAAALDPRPYCVVCQRLELHAAGCTLLLLECPVLCQHGVRK